MANLSMDINKDRRAYIPPELINAGFQGEVSVLTTPFTATIVKPGATLDQVKRSLYLTIQEVQLQLDGLAPATK